MRLPAAPMTPGDTLRSTRSATDTVAVLGGPDTRISLECGAGPGQVPRVRLLELVDALLRVSDASVRRSTRTVKPACAAYRS